ncbi:MAG: DUF2442 domain-containing protein [Bacteroidetes bacterium]|nr:MAG: DUF2442 domain-containing protein [Bacteroidota bacterium]
MEGFIGTHPKIKKILWTENTHFSIYLEDGRIITVPAKKLPSTKFVKPEDRKKYQILSGNMFTWNSCPEVYHIEQILGIEKDYRYLTH